MSDLSVAMISSATNEQVQALAVGALGLDATTLDLEAPEAIAALIRRAASFNAPCPPRVLRDCTMRTLRGLVMPAQRGDGNEDDAWERIGMQVSAIIESLIAYGDLLELPIADGAPGRTLYLAPPTFVRVAPTVLFIIGGRPDAVDVLPSELRPRVQCRSHTRRITSDRDEALPDRLRAFGLVELPSDMWFAPPRREPPAQAIARADTALASRATHGEVLGLSVLDPAQPPTYYPGRWGSPKGRSGRFVARREQQYGADLWAYVELSKGELVRLLDLPFDSQAPEARGCDEAWQLQLAIDAVAGRPQRFRLRSSASAGPMIVDFFSPIPNWARRKFDVLGEEVSPNRSLLSYRFDQSVFEAVRRSLQDELWLERAP